MKLTAEYKEHVINSNDDFEVTFIVKKGFYRSIVDLSNRVGKLLTLSISNKKETRSQQQNNLLWLMLRDIQLKQDGRKNNEEVNNLYFQMIRSYGLYTFAMIKKDDKEMITNAAGFFDEKGETIGNDGNTYIKGYLGIGSSNYDVEFMNDFLSNVMDYAAKCGVNVDYYGNEMKGLMKL